MQLLFLCCEGRPHCFDMGIFLGTISLQVLCQYILQSLAIVFTTESPIREAVVGKKVTICLGEKDSVVPCGDRDSGFQGEFTLSLLPVHKKYIDWTSFSLPQVSINDGNWQCRTPSSHHFLWSAELLKARLLCLQLFYIIELVDCLWLVMS